MSEANNIPQPGPGGGPQSRPNGDGLPKVDGGLKRPGSEDAVDPVQNDGDRGDDVPGGMVGEG
jgi:hypothetical protein